MGRQPYYSHDVDTDRLAEVLHDLANDIEEHGTPVTKVRTYTDVESDGDVQVGIGLEFIPLVGSRSLGNFANQYREREHARVIR